MKNTMKKLATAALIGGMALCGPATMNRAEAWEINKSIAADVVSFTGLAAEYILEKEAVMNAAYMFTGTAIGTVSTPVLLAIGTGYGCYRLISLLW